MSTFSQNSDPKAADQNYETIFGQLAKIFAEQLYVDLSGITPQSRLLEDLDATDIDVVEIIMAIEERFDVEIPDELLNLQDDSSFEGLRTVDDFVRLIENRLY